MMNTTIIDAEEFFAVKAREEYPAGLPREIVSPIIIAKEAKA